MYNIHPVPKKYKKPSECSKIGLYKNQIIFENLFLRHKWSMHAADHLYSNLQIHNFTKKRFLRWFISQHFHEMFSVKLQKRAPLHTFLTTFTVKRNNWITIWFFHAPAFVFWSFLSYNFLQLNSYVHIFLFIQTSCIAVAIATSQFSQRCENCTRGCM